MAVTGVEEATVGVDLVTLEEVGEDSVAELELGEGLVLVDWEEAKAATAVVEGVDSVAEEAGTDSSGRRRMQDDGGTRTVTSKPRKTSRALSLWSVKELEKYVRSVLGLAGVAGEINRQRVDGAMAVEMSKDEWKDMGATGLEAARIVSALKKFASAQRSR